MSEPVSTRASPWRAIAALSGLTRGGDLPLLLWPMVWAAFFARQGLPAPWHLVALIIAVLLARSAAWVGFFPAAEHVGQIPRERRLLLALFLAGALCFALPLGWAGALIPASLALLAIWFGLRRRSYLSDPLLAAALVLPAVAAWWIQDGVPSKAAGLLLFGSLFWILALLVTHPVQRDGANLAALVAPHRPLAILMLEGAALLALGLAGHQAHLGFWFGLGIAVALLLSLYRFRSPVHRWSPSPAVLSGWWGGALFAGLLLHLLLQSPATS